MVDGIFAPQEAKEIKNIPLAREATEDSLFWVLAQDGKFNCKLGYRFLKEAEDGPQMEARPNYEQGLWKKIWALACPNKVKNLVWRACCNSLPSKSNLLRRTVITDQTCDRCRCAAEDMIYAVWNCKNLDCVWEKDNTWNFRNQNSFSNFSELMAWVFEHQRKPALFAFTVWTIWTQRNQVCSQQPCCSLNHLSQLAAERFTEFRAIFPPTPPSRPRIRTRWKPPPVDIFKINFDGAVFAEENCSGVGVIVRNREGLVIATMSEKIPQILQPTEIEAMAATRALEFAREVGISEAILEGDSLLVIKVLATKDIGLVPFGLLIQDASRFTLDFSLLSYSHTKRDGNQVAHDLAKLAVTIPNCVIWMEDVPSDVVNSYQANLARIP